MSDMERTERIEALVPVLMKHFPSMDIPAANNSAMKLSNSVGLAWAMERIERGLARSPSSDVDTIKKAAACMRKAANHLSDVGAHGSATFPEVFRCLFSSDARASAFPSAILAQEELVERIIEMADTISAAADSIVTVEYATVEPPALQPSKSKPKKTTASVFARECAGVYYEQTGKLPKPRNRTVGQGAENSTTAQYACGPFLDFLTDMFKAAKVDGSPQVWAKEAGSGFSPKN